MRRILSLALMLCLFVPEIPAAATDCYGEGITRAEFCALVILLVERLGGEPSYDVSGFSDTNDPYVAKAAGLGLVNGVGGGRFEPDGALTRAQAARILMNAGLSVSLEMPGGGSGNWGEIPSWAAGGAVYAVNYGLLDIGGDGLFRPEEPCSRRDSILTLGRLYMLAREAG